MAKKTYPHTPDGRYFVSKSRLWRCTNPNLDDTERRKFVKQLMQARNAVRLAESEDETRAARKKVDAAKIALGERGPVWWDDGMEPQDRLHPKNSVYADWWARLPPEERAAGS